MNQVIDADIGVQEDRSIQCIPAQTATKRREIAHG